MLAKRHSEGLFCSKSDVDRLQLFHKIRTHLPTSEFPNRNDNPRNPNACVCELLKKKLTFSDDIQPQDTKSCNVRGTTAKHHRPQPEPLAFSVPFASAHKGVRQWYIPKQKSMPLSFAIINNVYCFLCRVGLLTTAASYDWTHATGGSFLEVARLVQMTFVHRGDYYLKLNTMGQAKRQPKNFKTQNKRGLRWGPIQCLL